MRWLESCAHRKTRSASKQSEAELNKNSEEGRERVMRLHEQASEKEGRISELAAEIGRLQHTLDTKSVELE